MEECDDGDDPNDGDLCFSCGVKDALAVPLAELDPGEPQTGHVLGLGRHPVAAGSQGIGVIFLETVEGQPSLGLATFDTLGRRASTVHDVQEGTSVLWDSDPVVAALPDGTFVVAWTDVDGDGDELGVAMRQVSPSEMEPLGALVRINTSTEFSQFHPDLLWDGASLVVSWMDGSDPFSGPDLNTRTFSPTLHGNGAETSVAHQDGAEGDVSLVSFEGSTALAWRDALGGGETLYVRAGASTWAIVPDFAGPAGEQPALLELDPTHLGVFYSQGVDGDADGVADSFEVRGAVLEIGTEEAVASVTLAVPDLTASSHEPSVVQVGDRAFVAWRTDAVLGEATGDDLWLAELTWSALETTLSAGEPIPLPREVIHRAGDQRRPALAAAPYWPEGALVAAWTDRSGAWGDPALPAHEEIVVELIPLPIVRTE